MRVPKIPKIPEKTVPLIILLAVVIAVLLFNNGTQTDTPSGNMLAVSGAGEEMDDSGNVLVETLSEYDVQEDEALNAEEKALERKVMEALSQMAGVGKAHVTITFEKGVLREYARDESVTERVSRETDSQGGVRETTERSSNDQVVLSGSDPVMVQVERAKIAGVLVVVEGGQDAQFAARVREAVRTLLGIEASKVSVVPMGK
ncbi:MAG: stage III sporulation protein AG [Peptococcaceae bacterium]|nr:stage III sporulation protein AG [Peptococcaceae bacterium]